MPALGLTALSAALLGAAAVAYTRQRTVVMAVCGALFVAAATAATVAVYWPASPAAGVLLLALAFGPSLLALLLYVLDRVFAVFCIEMTYPALICWVLWPALVAADLVGLWLIRLLGWGGRT
jgi:hypothetical protein